MVHLVGRRAAILSYRLGMADGVSVTAAQWATALRRLGLHVTTMAGAGRADVLVEGLAVDAVRAPSRAQLADALDGVDLVVVDNVCSLPMNPRVGEAVAEYLAGRPAVLRHHDLPWERERYAGLTSWPPDDPQWRHVTINEQARRALAERRGIAATTVHHGFDERPCPWRRAQVRAELGVPTGRPLVLQPTRAIARKNVHAGLALAAAVNGTFWLTGPAEDGFAPEVDRIVQAAKIPVRRGLPAGVSMAAAYAACDQVVLPSSWEGFGLPLVESAFHRRPIAVGDFPVARELAAFGFRWFTSGDPGPIRRWLADPDPDLLDHNEALARRHFGLDALVHRLDLLLSEVPMCHADRAAGVGLVAQHPAGSGPGPAGSSAADPDPRHHRLQPQAVVPLPGAGDPRDRPAPPVRGQVNLAGQSAPGPADGFPARPPGPARRLPARRVGLVGRFLMAEGHGLPGR